MRVAQHGETCTFGFRNLWYRMAHHLYLYGE